MNAMKLNYLFFVILSMLFCLSYAQENDPYDQRGVQFAAQGTDFWVCFPRTIDGMSQNRPQLMVVSERNCDVTVSNHWLDYSHTEHIARRRMCGPDTNYIYVPYSICGILDTFEYVFNRTPDWQYSGCESDRPQYKGFHVTSTDPISLFMIVHSMGTGSGCNILPTEMLRDEYVVQTPLVFTEDWELEAELDCPIVGMTPTAAMIDIVAAEDSTVVDIVLGGRDWMNRHPGDTVTVELQRGQLFHIGAGQVRENNPTLFEPYYFSWCDSHKISPLVHPVPLPRHGFDSSLIMLDTFIIDLSGTHIMSRDCKRIAVFESGGRVHIPSFRYANFDMLLEQTVPVRYAGKEFIVPNIGYSDTDYIRITGLHDGTVVTITDAAHPAWPPCTLRVNAYETNWFGLYPGQGPFYLSSTEPVMTRVFLMGCESEMGDPDFFACTPVEWWHNGQINYATLSSVDNDHNVQRRDYSLYIFTRTADAPTIYLDDYAIGTEFIPITGTPYSYVSYDNRSSYNSPGTHHIETSSGKPFMAFMTASDINEQLVYTLPHIQPGKTYLLVDGVPSDSLSPDSIRCLYDPVTFVSWDERPADSVIWIFGDGDTIAYSHLDSGFTQPQIHTYRDTGRYTVTCIFTYDYEGCYTRKPDTLTAPLWFHNHYDSSFSVHLCEGSYTFRGYVLDHTDTFSITTYWTESGCDTLWKIDFATCPHCSWHSDTVSTDQLPWLFHGQSFGYEVHDQPVYLDIDQDCDSIIYYTLIVIPNWGEPPFDSVFVVAPNVITPSLETNNHFSIFCSSQVLKAEVAVFNRFGTKVAEFDGLTGRWDGTSQGRKCHQGTYVYIVRYIDNRDSGWKMIKGTVTLVY